MMVVMENRRNVHRYRYFYEDIFTIRRPQVTSGKPSGTSSVVPVRVQWNTLVADVPLWFFGGGQYDRNEVIPLLCRPLDWLGQTIIPEAERLLP